MSSFSLNHATTKYWDLTEAIDMCARHDVGIGLWREEVAHNGLRATAAQLRDSQVTATSLCRGGFFTRDSGAALEDNRRAIDEAATLGVSELVLVCGGLFDSHGDIDVAREAVSQGLHELVEYAAQHSVRLAIEALHPMFASDRCVVSTLDQALDIAEQFSPTQVGVVVDTYHIWWDPNVWQAIARAGANERIACFQVADWVTPLPAGVLTGRGQLGDGCIPFRRFRDAVVAAGYTGPIEVEIFNETLWSRPGVEVFAETLARFQQHVA